MTSELREKAFRLGREVMWSTAGKAYQNNPHMSRYLVYGIITEVVAPKTIPTTYTDGKYTLGWRDHESYVVTVYRTGKDGRELKPKRYWPIVSRMSLVTPDPKEPDHD